MDPMGFCSCVTLNMCFMLSLSLLNIVYSSGFHGSLLLILGVSCSL